MKASSEVAATCMYAAFDPTLRRYKGAYLCDIQVHPLEEVRPWALARYSIEMGMLWKLSEEIVGQKSQYQVERCRLVEEDGAAFSWEVVALRTVKALSGNILFD